MFWKQLTLAARNLGRNRRRNAATASAIILGFAGLVLLSGFVVRIEKFFRATSVYLNHVGTISIYKPDGVERHLLRPKKYNLNAEEQTRVRQVVGEVFPNAEAVSATLHGFTLIGNGCKTWPVKVLGVEPAIEKKLTEHPAVQNFAREILDARLGSGLWMHSAITPVIVTQKVARNLGKSRLYTTRPGADATTQNVSLDCSSESVQSKIDADTNIQLAARTYKNDFSALDGEIVGHYSSGLELLEESSAVIPLEALQRLFETDTVTNIIVHLPWDEIPETAARKLDNALRSAGLDLEVHHYRELSVNPFYAGFMNLIYVMSAFFLTLAVSVVTLTVSDSMTMSVLERSKEIGTLRALGFRQRDIPRIFALEGLMLALICIPVGLILAIATTSVINSSRLLFEVPGVSTQLRVTLMIVAEHCVWIALLMTGVSILAGWITSLRSSRKRIVGLLNSHVS
ncbi:MAG: hypothetical protein RLZZ488_1851 [Pseudomonadota bacterium]|jgi:putative ABC transport system permease protein